MGLLTVKVRMPWSPRERGLSTERDADAEIARNLWRNFRLLPPTSPLRNRWDWVLVVLVTFTSWQIPFVLVFNLPDSVRLSMKVFDYIIDAFFWIDIMLNFTTSFYVEEELITSRKAIVKHQFTSWIFYADVMATFPWDDIAGSSERGAQALVGCLRSATAAAVGSNLKALRLLRLLRLRRVVIKVSQLKGGVALRFGQLIFAWFLIAHWTACLWWFIGKAGYYEEEDRECNDLPTRNFMSWLVRIPPMGKMKTDFSVPIFWDCVDTCLQTCTNRCTRISCMANYTCDDNNLNPDLSYRVPEVVWDQWLTSWYWALTMLMKMPNVGPDTTLEKMYSCVIVIVGAIFFALLLGQVTTLIMVMAKSGAQLRDQLVTMSTFAASRRVPSTMSATLKKHLNAEWTVTKGMDTQMLLQDFPTQLRGDVLAAVFGPLVDCNPPFLRCSEQLRRQILSLLKPSVALKKQTIIAGRQFGSTMYVLMKGTLQVSQAPESNDNAEENTPKTRDRRGQSMGKNEMKKQLTRMNTRSYKDKLKVRMLEKPGAIIPLDTIFEGPRTSPFSVFAVQQSQLLLLEANELARLLDSYPAADANIVTAALDAEFKSLTESLKMNRPAEGGGRSGSVAEARRESSMVAQPPKIEDDHKMDLGEKIVKMEEYAKGLVDEVNALTKQTGAMPMVLKALRARMGGPGAQAGGSSELEGDKKGGFFGPCGDNPSTSSPKSPTLSGSALDL